MTNYEINIYLSKVFATMVGIVLIVSMSQEPFAVAEANPAPVESVQTEITKDYVVEVLQLKNTDIGKYTEILNALTDEQYQTFTMYLPAAKLSMSEAAMNLSTPAAEAQGVTYIREKYGIDISTMSTEDFVVLMHTFELRNQQAFFDIIGNIPDDLYEAYYSANEYYTENSLFGGISSITPFAISEDGKLKSGSSVLTETENGSLAVPEHIMFLVTYLDGAQIYIYGNNGAVKYIPVGSEIRAVYTDQNGICGECLLTKDRHFVFSEEGSADYIFPISGNADIYSIGSKLTSEQIN